MSEMLANRYFREGRYEEAARHLETTITRHPERHSARRKLICCYLMTGRVVEALSATCRLFEVAPGGLEETDDPGESLPCRTPEEAERKLTRTLEPGEAHAARALIRLLCGKQGALVELDRSLAAAPDLGEAAALKRILVVHGERNHV